MTFLWMLVGIIITVLIILLAMWASGDFKKGATRAAAPGAAFDDLEAIEGIGPVIAGVMKKAGIGTFADLAKAKVEDLQKILTDADVRGADPTTWPEQASLAAKGEWEKFEALKEKLVRGKKA